MRRGVGAFVVAIALVVVGAAHASANARYGVQDDAWLMYGTGTLEQRLATLHGLGVGIVRFTLRWDQIAPTAPASPRDPTDPAYAWGQFANVLDGLHQEGIPALVTIYGSPRWANGGHPPNWLPATASVADFAYAASKEFPWVHMWTVWNEPNGRVFSVPVSPKLYVQRLLNPAYVALHQASSANLVAGGVTSPRQEPSGMSPLTFMEDMRLYHARLDAYAQNPYPVAPGETPFKTTCSHCTYLTMARLAVIRADVSELFGPQKQLWLTEYGYQTNPPDRLLGVPWATQALFESEAALHVWEQPGATVLIHFLVRDEPSLGGWQSGFFTATGAQKPSYRSFALPLVQVSRSGSRTQLWGQVRPGSGARPYAVQRWTGHGWSTVGGVHRTGSGGTFLETIVAPRGTKLRLESSQISFASPTLVVT